MKLKHYLTALLFLAIINFTPIFAHAQLDGVDCEGGDPDAPCNMPTDVPFDGGISILIAAGVAYGLKKGYDQKKATRDKEGSLI